MIALYGYGGFKGNAKTMLDCFIGPSNIQNCSYTHIIKSNYHYREMAWLPF